jgi:two-component system, cell cycle sensor histidine kinase and response regulator CckA
MSREHPSPDVRDVGELGQTPEELELYFAHAVDLLCVADDAGHFVRLNPVWERALGYPLHELLGRGFLELVHPDDVARTIEMTQHMAHGGELRGFQNRYVHRDGSVRWFDWTAYRSGEWTFAVARDITERQQIAEEADATRSLLEAVIRQSPLPLLVVDAKDHSVKYRNDATLALFGADRTGRYEGRPIENIRAERPWEIYTDDGRFPEFGELPLVRALQGGVVKDEHWRVVRADGSERQVLVNAGPIHASDGTLVAGLLTAVDETDQRRATNSLAFLNRQLRMISVCHQALIRATDEAALLQTICSLLVDEGGYRFAWVGFAEDDEARTVRPVAHAGYEAGYLQTGWSWGDSLPGLGPVGKAIRTNRPSIVQFIAADDSVSFWKPAALARGYAAICALPLTFDGRTRGTLAVYSPLEDAFGHDEVTLLAGLADDLAFGLHVVRTRAERAQAAEQVRINEERFRHLLRHSNDLILVFKDDSRPAAAFGAIERLLGYTAAELELLSSREIVHPEDATEARNILREEGATPGAVTRFEIRLHHKDGHWVPFECVGLNLFHDPSVGGLVLNLRDVGDRRAAETERRRLHEQLQQAMKLEAIGRLAGGVAHDFNNLLTAIGGNVELMKLDLRPSDPLMQPADAIGRAVESAAALTQQLLAFSRRRMVSPHVVNLNDLVVNLQRMASRLIGEHITVETRLPKDLGSVVVDPSQFEQVILNLVVNARDAMPDGGHLIIATENVELDQTYCARHTYVNPGAYVCLSVSDTGTGIDDTVKSHLFEPFYTTKAKGKGTGLGLATAFGTVKQAGGSIEVYSELGRGSTFKVYLPRVEQPAERLARASVALTMPGGHETVLLVEDDPAVRQVAISELSRLGYVVISASNGAEALALTARYAGTIDLLLTDVVMPGINGRVLAERFTQQRPGTRVLFSSGYTEDVILHHGVLDGDMNFISKPYTMAALANKVREVLDGPEPVPFPVSG